MTKETGAETAKKKPTKTKADATTNEKTEAGTEKFAFQAEVGKLLEIVAHSLYSHKEIFLRELISNSSDACDRLRYAQLTNPDLGADSGGFKIALSVDAKARTLSIADNGIGMNHDQLSENLGTIARSGTQAFIDQLTGDDKKDINLIGQFGVGFYASFMVAKKVEVLTRHAGEKKAWLWATDGKGEFTIVPAERAASGTTVTLYLNKDEDEFLEKIRLQTIVKKYSDHVAMPIVFADGGDGEGGTGGEKEGEGVEEETLNAASALWTRQKSGIDADQYKEFYHHVGHTFDDPWLTMHNTVEGRLTYTNLLFIPSSPPVDLFDPERKPHLKLYVNRVFITDDCEGLLPSYLRFLRGIVDSADLSLNVSREMLQHDPLLAKIRSGLVKRVLGELKKKAEKKADEYATFWTNFGAVLKEGIHEDFENREAVLTLSRFRSTASDDLTSLEAYVERMRDGQEGIYTISGKDLNALRQSPQLEGFNAHGIEVLLLTDPVDDFWIPNVGSFGGKPFKSATQGDADFTEIEDKDEAGDKKDGATDDKKDDALDPLVAALKLPLGETVKDVRVSKRLTDSPVCLVADAGDMDMNLERILRTHQQMGTGMATPRILEINPDHPLIKHLAGIAEKDAGNPIFADAAQLLLDQARIMEGEPVSDPIAFSRRLSAVMTKGLGA